MTPKTDLGVSSNTPGRTATQSPTQPLPLILGRGIAVVQWVTPVLHWHFRDFKLGQDAWFSAFGWVCCGPVDRICTIGYNDRPYNGVYKSREDYPGTDYIDHTMAFGDVTSRFRIWWGLETNANYSAYLQSLVGPDCPSMAGKSHPNYAGICAIAVHDVYAGATSQGQTPPLPKLTLEVYRRSVSAYVHGAAEHGTHPVGIVKDLLTLKRGGRGLPVSYFEDDHWAAQMQRLMDVGVATMKGTDLFLSFVFAQAKEADEHIADALSYFGGYLLERNGKLRIDWSPADGSTIDESGLRVISEHELADDDVDEDPGDLDGLPSQIKVTGLDWAAEVPLTEATESAPVPFAASISGGDPREPEPLSMPGFTDRAQLKSYATLYAAMRTNPDANFTVPVLRQYACQPDGVTPLRPGDLFVLNLALTNGGKRVVVRITERSSDGPVKSVFKCVRERGTFPKPAQPVLDPRLDPTVPPPADLARYAIAQLPPDLSDAADTYVTALVERPANSATMWQLDLAATNVWPGIVLETGNPRWAIAAVNRTALAALYADVTITVDTVGADWPYLRSQAALEQADDALLAYRGGEWFSVGTLTPLGGGSYTAALKRARLGSLPATHASGDVVLFIYRSNLAYLTNATFGVIEAGGVYDATTATKYFKLRPLGAGGVQGNFTAAIALTLRDPTPDTPTGLVAAVGTGKLVHLTWDAVTGALVNEYSVHRATGPAFADEAQIGEAPADAHPRYPDSKGLTLGTQYRYRVKAHATDESESAFSAAVFATPVVIDADSLDMTPPADSTAPEWQSGATYLSDDGTVYAEALIELHALPARAECQFLYVWRAGSAVPAAGTPYFNTGDLVVPVDDLTPGESYKYGLRAVSVNGVPSVNLVEGAAAFGAETNDATPAAPGSGGLTGDGVTPHFIPGSVYFEIGSRAWWDFPPNKDFAYFEFKVTLTNADGATNYSWHGPDMISWPARLTSKTFVFFTFPLVSGHARVRAVDRSGNPSDWLYLGQANAVGAYSIGTGAMAAQEPDDVNVTGITVGSGGSIPQTVREVPIVAVVTLVGGAPNEHVDVSLAGYGFSTKPDLAKGVELDGGYSFGIYYDIVAAGSTSANAVFFIWRPDGSDIPAGPQTIRATLIELF